MIARGLTFAALLVLCGIASGGDERPRRTTMPIGRSWNLTAEKHVRTIMEGERTKLLTSTGKPVLKHGANVIKGPWDIEAKADKIECDFVAKTFVLSGRPELKRLNPKSATVTRIIVGDGDAKIVVSFDANTISPSGNVTTTAVDGPQQ